jgi:hypothetical protein
MRGGRYTKTVVTNVPGAEVTSTEGIPNNLAAYMAGVFHSALTGVWATAPDNGTATPVWTTRNSERVAGADTDRSGFQPCLTSQGPGLVHAWINPATGFTRVARWDALTDAITLFDQPSGTKYTVGKELGPGIVVGSLYFVSGTTGSEYRTQVYNLETGAFGDARVGFQAQRSIPMATLNGNVYTGASNGSNQPAIYVWLGSWVQVAFSTVIFKTATAQITGVLFYERKGKLYLGAKSNATDGLTLYEFDPALPGVLTDVTSIVDGTIASPTPGITVATTDWTWGFYVDVDTLGVPRYMLQLVPNRKINSPTCVLYEHTDAGIVLIGSTDLGLATNCYQQAPYCVAGLTFKEGGLWGVQSAAPQPHPLGMLLTYRFGGDPGNADTILRLAVASPLAAPDARANTLVAPVGGLGQGGASLVDEGGGVWRIDNWDADGVTDLTVVHQTLVDGIVNGVLTDWVIKASKT